MRRLCGIRLAGRLVAVAVITGSPTGVPARSLSNPELPEPEREFRAAWIATVHNIDWPSRPGLAADAQKAELRLIMDKARAIGLNALLLQVRPACDSLFMSHLEPWSPYLTGNMGGDPGYDPLAFAVAEAHARGLELHAWFNPYRALASNRIAPSSDHVKNTRPTWVRRIGTQLWLDPGAPGVDDYVAGIIRDVVRRYDIDGVHLDDYFYPYPPAGAAGRGVDFDDASSWVAYQSAGGKLSKSDWRRENVNRLVRKISSSVRAEKSWVRFGISPFGIWRPGVPQGIEADLDAFEHLSADARLWLAEGLVDYLSPQLYWNIEPRKQSFATLLAWWREQPSRGRPIWPGIAIDRIGKSRDAAEVLRQIGLARASGLQCGHIHWGLGNLLSDRDKIATRLAAGPYKRPALPPVLPWLSSPAAAKPNATRSTSELRFSSENTARWLLQIRERGTWREIILPGTASRHLLEGQPDLIALRGVGRDGRLSPPTLFD